MMIKINFYGGPGSGKSTVSSLLFSELKMHSFNAELVREVAKDMVYQGIDMRDSSLDLQFIVFAKQLEREMLVEKHVDFLISDSPLFLNAYYSNQDSLVDIAKRRNNKQDLNIWIERDPNEKFETEGRSHTEKQSLKIDQQMKNFLTNICGLNLIIVKGTAKEKSSFIVNLIIKKLNEKTQLKSNSKKTKKV